MFRLLLVSDSESYKKAYEGLSSLEKIYLKPFKITDDIDEAFDIIQKGRVDAVCYALEGEKSRFFSEKLLETPSFPVFTAYMDEGQIIDELKRVSRFLSIVNADMLDSDGGADYAREHLRDEFLSQLISGKISDPLELTCKTKLLRANISLALPCYIFDFDMPMGEVYLSDTWHYGKDRLQAAIRNNFLGRYVEGIYYDAEVMTQRHIRVFACPEMGLDEDKASVRSRAEERARLLVGLVKNYLGLDLYYEQTTELKNIYELCRFKPV